MTTTSRRRVLGAATVTGLGTALSACGAGQAAQPVNSEPTIGAASGPVRLTYWTWLKDLQSVCDVWNADHPAIQVEAVWIGAGNSGGYSKMYSALAAGGGGDIAQVEFQLLPSFLLQNGLVDLSRYGFRDHLDSFRPADISRVSVGDSVFGVPQDTGPMGLFYRRDVFEEVGVTPPATWQEWLDVAHAIRQSDPARHLEGFNVNDPGNFTSYCMQAGAEWFTVDGEEWVVDLTGEPTRMVAQFLDQAFGEDLFDLSLGAFTPGWYAAAADGRISSVITGSWGDALVESVGGTEGKWAVAPMPRWPDTGFVSATLGGSTSAVMSTSQHPHEALEFILWMSTTPKAIDLLIKNSGIGWSPSPDFIGTVRQQPVAFFSGQNYNEEVFVPAADGQNPDWIWSPIYLELNDALSTAVRIATSGGTSLADALPGVQDRVLDIMRHKGLRVRSAQ